MLCCLSLINCPNSLYYFVLSTTNNITLTLMFRITYLDILLMGWKWQKVLWTKFLVWGCWSSSCNYRYGCLFYILMICITLLYISASVHFLRLILSYGIPCLSWYAGAVEKLNNTPWLARSRETIFSWQKKRNNFVLTTCIVLSRGYAWDCWIMIWCMIWVWYAGMSSLWYGNMPVPLTFYKNP